MPPPPPWPPPKPPRNAADVTISVMAMVMTVVVGAAGAVIGLFSVAFIDHCPPATCSAEGAVTAVMTAVAAAGFIGLAGVVVAIVRLGMRKTAWPYAVGTLGLCLLVLFFGGVGYVAAVS